MNEDKGMEVSALKRCVVRPLESRQQPTGSARFRSYPEKGHSIGQSSIDHGAVAAPASAAPPESLPGFFAHFVELLLLVRGQHGPDLFVGVLPDFTHLGEPLAPGKVRVRADLLNLLEF